MWGDIQRARHSYARRKVCHIMSFCNGTGSGCVRNFQAHGQRLLVDYRVRHSHDLQADERRKGRERDHGMCMSRGLDRGAPE